MIIIKVKERNMCTSEANSKSRKFQKTPFDVLFLANSLVYTYFPFNINLSVQQERSHSGQFNSTFWLILPEVTAIGV